MSGSLSFILPSFFLCIISFAALWWRLQAILKAEASKRKKKKQTAVASTKNYHGFMFLSLALIFGAYGIWYGLSRMPQQYPFVLSYPLTSDVNGFTNKQELLKAQQMQQQQTSGDMGSLAAGLEAKLLAGSAPKEQWFLLAKTYQMSGNLDKVAFAAIEGLKAHQDMPEMTIGYKDLLQQLIDAGYGGQYADQAKAILAAE